MGHRNDSDEPEEEQLKQEPEQEPAQEPEETLGASSGGGGAPFPRTHAPAARHAARESARHALCERGGCILLFSYHITAVCFAGAFNEAIRFFLNSNVP